MNSHLESKYRVDYKFKIQCSQSEERSICEYWNREVVMKLNDFVEKSYVDIKIFYRYIQIFIKFRIDIIIRILLHLCHLPHGLLLVR